MNDDQKDLPLFQERPSNTNVEWLVTFLQGRDWTTAAEILAANQLPVTENHKRRLRAFADASGGRIAGHQKGYKLVKAMTGEEYTWWRNEWLKASDSIKERVIQSDHIFYGRQAVPA
jgi:hypothetical protein